MTDHVKAQHKAAASEVEGSVHPHRCYGPDCLTSRLGVPSAHGTPEDDKAQSFAKVGPITKRPLRSDPFSPEPIDNPEALTDVNSPLPDATLTHGLKITSESVDPQESLTLPTIMMPSELEDSGVRTRDLSLDILLPTAIAQSGVDSSLDPEQPEGTAIDITEIRDDEDLTDAIAQPTAESVPLENRTTAVALPSPPVNREAELPPATVVLGITSAPVTLQLDFPGDRTSSKARRLGGPSPPAIWPYRSRYLK